MSKQDAVKKAEQFCEQHDITTYPVDIITICNDVGLKVFEEYLPSELSGFIIVQDSAIEKYGTNQVIVVNSANSARRRRFTIAHELAHYILHRKENERLFAHRDVGKSSAMETDANIFASNVLMPEHLVREELAKTKSSIWGEAPLFIKSQMIADRFAVSESAALVRLKQLGER